MKKPSKPYNPKVCVMCGTQVGTMYQLITHMREAHQGKLPLKTA